MKLKILQWNIWYKESIYNTDAILDFINRIDADIVCLQEINSLEGKEDTIKKIVDNFPYGSFALADKLPDGRTQGNGIFSKYPIIKKEQKFIQKPSNNSDYSQEGRVYLECELNIDGNKLIVGTTHCSYTHKFEENEFKNKEIGNLLSFIKNNKDKYIFSGDLNASENSKYILEFENIFDICVDINDKTWTTKPFDYNGFTEDKLNWKLDYTFKTNDIKLISSQVLKTELSDHLPTLIEIEI